MIRDEVLNSLPEEIKQQAILYSKEIDHNYADNREELEEDVTRAWLDGFAFCLEGRVQAISESIEKQLKDLRRERDYWKESSKDWRHKYFKRWTVKRLVKKSKQLRIARDLVLKLYNAGRDVLMCNGKPSYEEAMKRLEYFINLKEIEDFIEETRHD